jgi:hypothetical protein
MVFSRIINLFVALIKYVVALIIKYVVALIKYVVALIKYVAWITSCPHCQANAEREDLENPTPPFWHHSLLQRTLQTALTIKLAVLPLGLLAIFLLYVGINIDPILRSEKIILLRNATTYVLAGLFVLEHMGKYFPVVCMVVLFIRQVILFEKSLNIGNLANFFPDLRIKLKQFLWPLTYAGALFVVILHRYVITYLYSLNSRLRTVYAVITNIYLNWIVSMIYIYTLPLMVMDTKDETKQVILLAITPFLPVIPIVICDRCTLIEISKITNRVYGFIFVCLSRGIVISLCRIIQADFTSIWLFMGVSLFQGFLKVAGKATEGLRGKVLTDFFKRPRNPKSPRFMADIEIQDMLFECTTLILSQGLVGLSLIQTCGNSHLDVLNKSLVRIAIGLGIDFIFNCLSIFIQMRWYHVPLHTAWLNHWKYHMLVNVFALSIILLIHKPSLITAYEIQNDNCTSVFTHW